MALPALRVDLAPPGSLWHQHHLPLGWAVLAAGALALALALGATVRAYGQAARAGRQEGLTLGRTRAAELERGKILEELRNVDVARELPRWHLAERILTERSLPWSRLTAELERSMVLDVRVKSLQRARGADRKVQIKVKGEALTRPAEAAFIESLQGNACFDQVILEREGERQGGGVDFECTLAAREVPPPYTPLPRCGPQRAPGQARPGGGG